MFITFEGGEGSGKSTLAKMLFDYLISEEFSCIITNDPCSNTEELKQLRHLLLSEIYDYCKDTELMLYIASRAQLVHSIIRPALDERKIVICDRFLDSTKVYQGYVRGHSQSFIDQCNQKVCGNIKPDVTILCDVDAKIGLQRSLKRLECQEIDEGKFESLGLPFHTKINQVYRDLAKSEDRFIIIDSTNQTINEMFAELLDHMQKRYHFFPLKYR